MSDLELVEQAIKEAENKGWHPDEVRGVLRHIVVTEAHIPNALKEFRTAQQRARDSGIDLNRAYNLAKFEQMHELLESAQWQTKS